MLLDLFDGRGVPESIIRADRHCVRRLQANRERRCSCAPRTFDVFQTPGGAEMQTLRLLVADDHEVVRKGVCSLIEEQPGWKVAAEAVDGRDAIEKVRALRPDVTVMDVSMPSLNGVEATRQIVKHDVRTKVLIFTMHDSDRLIRDALNAGARGYILKSDAGRDLVPAVDALHRNKTFFMSKVAQMVMDGYLKTDSGVAGRSESDSERLTPRQREIVQQLAEGKSTKEVAIALGISVKTAETHRANIMRRLDCHCVSDLVRYAIRNHLVEA